MGDKSRIEWTEATWNPIAGCSIVSPGCTNCYAMRRVAPRLASNPATPHYAGTVQASKAGYVWTGTINLADDKVLMKPLRWRRPRMIFVNSTSDLFHESVPDAMICGPPTRRAASMASTCSMSARRRPAAGSTAANGRRCPMVDLVGTCPKGFWVDWIAEGDPAGEPWSGTEWGWYTRHYLIDRIEPGERFYVVAHGRLRGWAPVVGFARNANGRRVAVLRRGDAVACTIEAEIPGFRGLRMRWWPREAERAFPGWKTTGVVARRRPRLPLLEQEMPR